MQRLGVPLHETTGCKTLPKQHSRDAQRGKKNHCLLAEKILIISIKGRHCIHKDNISKKACTKVLGSAVQSTNQSLERQWMGCNTYCDTCPGIRELSSSVHQCLHQYISVLINTSLHSPAVPAGHTHTAEATWCTDWCLHQGLLTTAL